MDVLRIDFDGLVSEALKLGAAHASRMNPPDIPYSEEFRRLCEQNKCGQYGKNWMCPPGVGPFRDIIEKAIAFGQGFLFQTVHQLNSSLDWRGMASAAKVHYGVLKEIRAYMNTLYGKQKMLTLGAGPCQHCAKCAYLEEKPCYFPDEAVSSLESYGVDVSALLKMYGIPYHHGKNTVSYVGCMLF